jgi:hypothetical protein
MILCQTCDLDPETNEKILRAICASLRIDED